VLAFTFAVSILTGILFGLAPALRASRVDLNSTLKTGGRNTQGDGGLGGSQRRLRSLLVVGELAISMVLLVGAGLLIRSFTRLTAVETGFDPSHVVAAQLVFPADYPIGRKAGTIDAILTRLRALPGVEAAGFSRAGILIGEELIVGTFVPPGRTLADMRADPVRPRLRSVSRDYLTAIGVRLIAGRELDAKDTEGAPTVILVSRAVAQRFFRGGNAVGQYMDWYANSGKAPAVQAQIVGVVADIHNTSPDRDPVPEVYAEYRQLIAIEQQWGDAPGVQDVVAIGFLSLAIRTAGDPLAAIPALGRAVRDAEPNAGIESMLPMDRLVFSTLARQRFYAVLLAVLAGVAALLAAIGIYGVLAYAVAQRTREIGIRMALGAQRAQVLALVLRNGLILTAVGIALGLGGAVAATRLLQSMLFGVTPLDPQTFIVVSLLFGLVATVASYLPARRATTVDPMVALRSE
jgi:predicted permease